MKNFASAFRTPSRETDNSFRNYLICELETYSDETLERLWGDIQEAQVRESQSSRTPLPQPVPRMGYKSLEEVEQKYISEKK
jgi:hypothetical protein